MELSKDSLFYSPRQKRLIQSSHLQNATVLSAARCPLSAKPLLSHPLSELSLPSTINRRDTHTMELASGTSPLIPQNSLKDTVAILILLLSLPPLVSASLLTLYILTSSSRSFALKLFKKVFRTVSKSSNTTVTTGTNSLLLQKEKESLDQKHVVTSFLFIGLFDVIICVILKISAPNVTKLVFVLAKAIIATSLSGSNVRNAFFACFFIISLDYAFKNLIVLLDEKFGIVISSDLNLFPYLSNLKSPFASALSYLFSPSKSTKSSHYQIDYPYSPENPHDFLFKTATYILNYFSLLLSTHIILIGFSSVYKNNFISKNLNHLSSIDPDFLQTTFSPFLYKKEKDEKKLKIIEIEVDPSIAQSEMRVEASDNLDGDDITPAAYPSSRTNDEYSNPLSKSSIVSENFEVFCKTPFTKAKSVKSLQPLWSLIATARVMNLRKDVYSGEVSIDDGDNNSLVLSNYTNNYDEYKFSNYTNDLSNNSKILIFVDYIGETLICFHLENYKEGSIIVRVNGVIWYQVSSGFHNDDVFFIVGGLTPLSQYDVQFIIEEENEQKVTRKYLIDELIVSTVDSNGDDISTNNNVKAKVSSPLATLQDSLITTNDNLIKERLNLKKHKKEYSKKIGSIKQDTEQLKKIIENSDKNDEKNYKKLLSLRSSLKQVEEETNKVETEITEIEIEESEINEIYTVEKRKFDLAQRNFQNYKNAFNNKVNTKRDQLKSLNADIENLNNKKERVQAKLDKAINEVQRLEKDVDELVKNDLEKRLDLRNKRMEKRDMLLNEFKKEINKIEEGVMRLTKENESLRNGQQPQQPTGSL